MYLSEISLRGGLILLKNPKTTTVPKKNFIKPPSILEEEAKEALKNGLEVLSIGSDVPTDITVGSRVLIEPGAPFVTISVGDESHRDGVILISEAYIFATLPKWVDTMEVRPPEQHNAKYPAENIPLHNQKRIQHF